MHGLRYHGTDPFNSVTVSALRAGLRPALPALYPRLKEIIAESLRGMEVEAPDAGGKTFILPSFDLLTTT